MLRYRSDLQTVAYMITATALIVWQWSLPALSIPLFVLANFMAVTITVIAHNHNHLRITRILLCLVALGLPERARAFLQALGVIAREYRGAVTAETLDFWRTAVRTA